MCAGDQYINAIRCAIENYPNSTKIPHNLNLINIVSSIIFSWPRNPKDIMAVIHVWLIRKVTILLVIKRQCLFHGT